MLRSLLFLLGAALAMGMGCTAYYYAPNTLQTPFLAQRHDTYVSVGGVSGPGFSGFEFHGSYAFSRRWAAMVNHLQVRGGTSSEQWGKGRLTEVALGPYFTLGDVNSHALFLGWGSGEVFHRYSARAKSSLSFHRYFGQYGVCIEREPFRLGTAIRLNYLQYRKGQIDYRLGEPDISKIERIEEESPILFPETGFSLSVGSRPAYFSVFMNYMDYRQAEELGLAVYTMGISMSLQLDYLWRSKVGSLPNRSVE